MPNLDAAKKAVRQSDKRRVVNDKRRRSMRESVKTLRESVVSGVPTPEQLSKAFQSLDKAAKRGVIKKGTADRKKSRLSKLVASVTK
jgi:small subunit ribosomal protein S20